MTRITTSTILVVDDEPKHLIAISRHITNALPACCVYMCNEREKVLLYTERVRPHTIIIDDHMSSMECLTLIQAIVTRWPKTPVILMTDVATPDVYDAAQIAGCAAVITKPLVPTLLASMIEQALPSRPVQFHHYETIAAQ